MEPSTPKNSRWIQKEIDKWKALPEDSLMLEVKEVTDSGNHWEFVKNIYPMINDSKLKNRIDALLLNAVTKFPFEKESYIFGARAIYICAKLHLPQAKEVILKVIRKIGEPLNVPDPAVLPYLNDALKELKLLETAEFLSKELDMLAGMQKSEERYWKYASALSALEEVDKERSNFYRNKFELYPAYKPAFEWDRLSDEELKIEIRKNIQGLGGWQAYHYLSFIPEYYTKLENSETKKKVDGILIELMSEVGYGVGERSIHICSNLRLENITERVLGIIGKTDQMFEIIRKSPVAEDWSTYIDYIREINNAVRFLNIVEAKDFLVKQLGPLDNPVPQPVTKEFYLYHLAQSALDTLKKIDPELAKKY